MTSTNARPVSDLASLVAPMPVTSFIDEVYGRAPVLLPGDPDRLASLLPWPTLERVIEIHHRAVIPGSPGHLRVRLGRDDRLLPEEAILDPEGRFDRRAVVEQLRAGATLMVLWPEELVPEVAELVRGVAATLQEPCQCTAYLSWGSTPVFSAHRDQQDSFILQLVGRKTWTIRTGPYRRPGGDAPEEIFSRQTIEPGDVFYIPRGWWHHAVPHPGEPSFHLNLRVHRRTGTDLARWLAEELRSLEVVRADLPRFGDEREQERRYEALRDAVLSQLDEEALDRYLACSAAELDAQLSPWLPFDQTHQMSGSPAGRRQPLRSVHASNGPVPRP